MFFVSVPFPIAFGLLGLGFATFAHLQGWPGLRRPKSEGLGPYPFDPLRTQLILGEVHNQDGSRSHQPGWLILPEKGMYTGILVTGATGSSKTMGAHGPYLAQLIRLHAHDRGRKFGGLVIDSKGTESDFVREECRHAGRAEDYYEVSLQSGVRYNPVARPDLSAPALGGHIGDVIANYQGQSDADPFWREAAKDLATQVIRLVRLAAGREPTMADLYRLSTSPTLFKQWVIAAEDRARREGMREKELQSLQFWYEAKLASLDPRLRASVAAGLNGMCSLFDVGEIAETFCPEAAEENFKGFDELINSGLIVSVRIPRSVLKTVADVVGTLVKLNFQDAVLARMARQSRTQLRAGRGLFFVADEYDQIVSQPADGDYLSKCREARTCTILLTQSYESIVAKLKNEHVCEQLFANLRTKIWLCAEDYYTARRAADLCGEIERMKESHNRSESLRKGAFSYFDGRIVGEEPADVGAARTTTLQREHLFPPRDFMNLQVNQAIARVFDGGRVLEPSYVYLKPLYADPNVSWFDAEDRDQGLGERARNRHVATKRTRTS